MNSKANGVCIPFNVLSHLNVAFITFPLSSGNCKVNGHCVFCSKFAVTLRWMRLDRFRNGGRSAICDSAVNFSLITCTVAIQVHAQTSRQLGSCRRRQWQKKEASLLGFRKGVNGGRNGKKTRTNFLNVRLVMTMECISVLAFLTCPTSQLGRTTLKRRIYTNLKVRGK